MTHGYRPEIIQSAFVDFIGARLNPFWSLTVPKLRLMSRVALSEDLIALQFETNHAFKKQVFDLQQGWAGGQHINISVPIDGIHHQRRYSLVGLAKEQLLYEQTDNDNNAEKSPTVTIAIKPQGLVSDYLTKHAALGAIFNSGMPSGDFTLAQAAKQANLSTLNPTLNKQSSLLFIAGGSGITPMLGLIMQALQSGQNVTLLHYNRMPLLTTYWANLAKKYATFTYHLIHTEDPSTYLANSRYLSAQVLLSLELPLADTQIFACGSQTFLAELYRVVDEIELASDPLSINKTADTPSLRDNIMIERFGTALPDFISSNEIAEVEPKSISLRTRQRQFTTSTTLLLGAEQAGLKLPYGCRQGICQMCRCHKISGVVKNIQTGKMSTDGLESIQTCIHVAMTDVILDI
ncbi:flavin reductase family protein [Psychrobacter urativorans]|uniref:Oxidoreductase n=1 Tax=Psychrobacter urativorans TaxID=45610 RepID=A0A0M3V913_9GAMM|nr:iron-sulfur cluster-binding domain-containing protein [Psychrobacter urativorans]ALF59837.1 oxidoreductase [Psychrobacter urativorans]